MLKKHDHIVIDMGGWNGENRGIITSVRDGEVSVRLLNGVKIQRIKNVFIIKAHHPEITKKWIENNLTPKRKIRGARGSGAQERVSTIATTGAMTKEQYSKMKAARKRRK